MNQLSAACLHPLDSCSLKLPIWVFLHTGAVIDQMEAPNPGRSLYTITSRCLRYCTPITQHDKMGSLSSAHPFAGGSLLHPHPQVDLKTEDCGLVRKKGLPGFHMAYLFGSSFWVLSPNQETAQMRWHSVCWSNILFFLHRFLHPFLFLFVTILLLLLLSGSHKAPSSPSSYQWITKFVFE